jgi:malate synthase
MEDAATAEISRAQLWQWIRYGSRLNSGRRVDCRNFASTLRNVLNRIKYDLGVERFASTRFERAAELLISLSTGEFQEFLTTAAYAEFD